MCISFQFRKHLSLGRGGIILTDNKEACIELKKMSYDGRHPIYLGENKILKLMGYHYYMTPRNSRIRFKKLPDAIKNKPIQWN
jgi:dTDP-4-amino-4,6-dideoxygalactose transaminase